MRFFRLVATSLLAVSMQGMASGQAGPKVPALGPQPVVHADRTVTFQYLDPAATKVGVSYDGHRDPFPMEKDAKGIWSYTTPALAPEIYGYHLEVDGRSALDPSNFHVQQSYAGVGDLFTVPGTPAEPWERAAVPHGAIHVHEFTTKVVQGLELNQDSFYVYTPPGYDARAKTRYPVLYLLHGWGQMAGDWATVGEANEMMDNLIAAGKAKPMIVVMPLGYGDMQFVRQGWGAWQKTDEIDHNTGLFQKALLTEVIPQVEAGYNVAAGRDNRAIAGLSMGGLEAISVGLNNTGQFGWIGGFSGAVHKLDAATLTGLDPKKANLHLLWIACGTEDGLIEPNRKLIATLKAEGLSVTAIETPGEHVWQVWRDNLVHFVPLLFQGK